MGKRGDDQVSTEGDNKVGIIEYYKAEARGNNKAGIGGGDNKVSIGEQDDKDVIELAVRAYHIEAQRLSFRILLLAVYSNSFLVF